MRLGAATGVGQATGRQTCEITARKTKTAGDALKEFPGWAAGEDPKEPRRSLLYEDGARGRGVYSGQAKAAGAGSAREDSVDLTVLD